MWIDSIDPVYQYRSISIDPCPAPLTHRVGTEIFADNILQSDNMFPATNFTDQLIQIKSRYKV